MRIFCIRICGFFIVLRLPPVCVANACLFGLCCHTGGFHVSRTTLLLAFVHPPDTAGGLPGDQPASPRRVDPVATAGAIAGQFAERGGTAGKHPAAVRRSPVTQRECPGTQWHLRATGSHPAPAQRHRLQPCADRSHLRRAAPGVRHHHQQQPGTGRGQRGGQR